LGYVAKLGNPVAGFAVLFSFALGLGMLLIIIGTFSSSIALMPQAGTWMTHIKKIFGFLMLGVCIFILQPLLSSAIALLLYGLLVLIAGLSYLASSFMSLDQKL